MESNTISRITRLRKICKNKNILITHRCHRRDQNVVHNYCNWKLYTGLSIHKGLKKFTRLCAYCEERKRNSLTGLDKLGRRNSLTTSSRRESGEAAKNSTSKFAFVVAIESFQPVDREYRDSITIFSVTFVACTFTHKFLTLLHSLAMYLFPRAARDVLRNNAKKTAVVTKMLCFDWRW